MYFVFQSDKGLVGEYAHFDGDPEGYDRANWISGDQLKVAPPTLRLETNPDYSTKLTDLLLTRINLLVFSPNLSAVLDKCGVKNIDYYPVEVVSHEDGSIDPTYRAANIYGTVNCLDEENSTVHHSSMSGTIQRLKKFSIHEDRVSASPDMKCNPLLFRLGEFKYIILAHESVRSAVEGEGLTGIEFVETKKYVGF